MRDDEQAIRELIATWQRATAANDLPQILRLMAEGVVFLVPGQPPMRGKDAFAAGFRKAVEHYRIETTAEIQEIQVTGEWAYAWTHLSVTMTPLQAGPPMQRTGYTLTIFRKQPDGGWVLYRDANLLSSASGGAG